MLADLGASFLRFVLHQPIATVQRIDTQLPKVLERRADLLLEVIPAAGAEPYIHHVEAQRQNEANFQARMLLTAALLAERYPGRRIDQTAIYFGEEPSCRLAPQIEFVHFRYGYRLIDMRSIDCWQLLAASEPEAAVLAVLCQATDRTGEELGESILARLFAETSGERRARLLFQLETLAVNRRLEAIVTEKVGKTFRRLDQSRCGNAGNIQRFSRSASAEIAAALARQSIGCGRCVPPVSSSGRSDGFCRPSPQSVRRSSSREPIGDAASPSPTESFPGRRYSPAAQAPRSISRQRSEQKGRKRLAGSQRTLRPQIGQRTLRTVVEDIGCMRIGREVHFMSARGALWPPLACRSRIGLPVGKAG